MAANIVHVAGKWEIAFTVFPNRADALLAVNNFVFDAVAALHGAPIHLGYIVLPQDGIKQQCFCLRLQAGGRW